MPDNATEPETAPRTSNGRAQRAWMVAAAVVAAAVVIVVVILVTGSGSGAGVSHVPTTKRQAQSVASQVALLLAGIPQSGTRLGSARAPVTMTYYGDLECPYCAAFTVQGGFSQLVAADVRTGRVKVVYRSLCTATCNDSGSGLFVTQQVAAYAAGEQHRFWQYAELFYREQGQEGSGYVTQSYLTGLARQVPGLKLARWRVYLKDPVLVSQLQADAADGARDKARSTPTLVISGPRGREQVPTPSDGIATYHELQQTIREVS